MPRGSCRGEGWSTTPMLQNQGLVFCNKARGLTETGRLREGELYAVQGGEQARVRVLAGATLGIESEEGEWRAAQGGEIGRLWHLELGARRSFGFERWRLSLQFREGVSDRD